MRRKIDEKFWYSAKNGLFGPEHMREYGDILTEEKTKNEMDFILKTVKLAKGSAIFDVPYVKIIGF